MRHIINAPVITGAEVRNALEFCSRQIIKNLSEFTYDFPTAASEGQFYKKLENKGWTTGFWTGEIWLAYEFTKEECLKEAGLIQCDSFLKRITNKISVAYHDMGFLYSPSCVAGYKILGYEPAKEAALLAADHLRTMFREKGEFIQAWGQPNEPEYYKFIIDCLLNIPLLFWASEITGDGIYKDIALRHFRTAKRFAIREDGSAKQAVYFDVDTGEYAYDCTNQGYSNKTTWSRGQSWAVYGAAIAYHYTGLEECLNLFRKSADYFVNHLPENLIPYFDLCFTEGDEWPRDSSSSAVAACGMLEMAKYLEAEEATYYVDWAKKLLKALVDQCMVRDTDQSNGLLLHSTYACETPFNRMDADRGKDECCSFGDYYFMEALIRLHQDWNMYW